MSLVNSSFAVNVTPGAMPPTVHVSEYDIGRTYTVTINGQNGSAFNIPAGTTATVEGTLNGVIGFTTGATINGSTVSFKLTESMTACSGTAWCKIKLSLNDEPIQTCAFVLAVDRAGVEADTVIGAPGFDEQIQDAVDNYLEEHPVPTVTVDPTLTISGAAADAKVTGDKFDDLKSALSIVENEILLEYTLANDLTINGYIKSDGNIITQSSDDWKVSDYVLIPEICSGVYVKKCYPLSSTNLNIAFYDSSQTYIANSGQQLNIETGISGSQSPKTITIPEGAKYVRFGTHKQVSDYHGFDAILLMADVIEYIYPKIDQALSGMSAINTELGTTDFSLADDLNNIGYIDSNGVVHSSADWRVSDLIKLQESCTGVYVTKCYPLGNPNLNIAFYDSEKTFISGYNLNVGTGAGSHTPPTTIVKPSTAKYIRMGTHKAVEEKPYYVFNASFVYADVIEDIYKEIDNVRASSKRQLICDVIAPLVSGTKNYHVKLIGDSITAGVGGTGYDVSSTGGGDWIYQGYYSNVAGYCWANLLKAYWESKLNCTVYNYGMSGRKSGHLVQGINSWLHNDDDIVICMIGTNDRNLNETDPITGETSTQTTFYNNLKTIVEDVQSAGKKIILMSNIPAYNENNPNFDMADVDHVVMKVATEYNMEYVSVYDLMMEYCKYTGTSLNSLLVDGLHPNDSGYLVMFRLITQALCVSPEREDFGN